MQSGLAVVGAVEPEAEEGGLAVNFSVALAVALAVAVAVAVALAL
tara:strand:+ start:8846 stop:8980 length:135 start_codon:yes stop_codon:yes gene_type:complete